MNHNPMNPALLRRRAFRTLGLILVLSLPLRSTTLVVFFTPHGAIIGADSKSTDATLVDTGKGPVTKIAVVQDHIAIASVGLGSAGRNYNFAKWIQDIQSGLPNNLSVASFARVVETESSKIFRVPIRALLSTGKIKPQAPDEFCEPFLEYIIVGYDAGRPTLYEVEFHIDWNQLDLLGPTEIVEDLSAQPGNVHSYSFGVKEAITDITDRQSYAYKQTMIRCPKAFGDLVSHRDISLDETVAITRALIEVEKSTNPRFVGGASQIVRILPTGRAYKEIEGSSLPKKNASKTSNKSGHQQH